MRQNTWEVYSKRQKEKEEHHQELIIGPTGTTYINLDSFS